MRHVDFNNRIAIYAGSFDPPTYGHLNIIKRISQLFDKIIIAVATNKKKKYLFNIKERLNLIHLCCLQLTNIEIHVCDKALVDFALNKKAKILIRSLRNISDFTYELQMATINKKLSQQLETFFLASDTDCSYISSSMVKELLFLDQDISKFIPNEILDIVINKK